MDSNCQQQSQDSFSKSESGSQTKSNSRGSRSSSTFAHLAQSQLLTYQDVNESEFELLPISCPGQLGSEYSTYLNYHTTEVPVGANYQASIPRIRTAQAYQRANQKRLEDLKRRKVHDPPTALQFYRCHKSMVEGALGQRSYEELNVMRNAFVNSNMGNSFEDYFKRDVILEFWEGYFMGKEKTIMKHRRRKKKIK